MLLSKRTRSVLPEPGVLLLDLRPLLLPSFRSQEADPEMVNGSTKQLHFAFVVALTDHRDIHQHMLAALPAKRVQ